MTLLIDTSGVSEEKADLFLLRIAMNLLMQENIDVTDSLDITLVGQLDEVQWEALLPRIHACIPLRKSKDQEISLANTSSYGKFREKTITFCELDKLGEDYCLFLTIPERLDYLMINLLSDVYLDTLDWSGGNTSLEAIACNLPIVTCPGEFMRGRHSYSFLKMLGVTDTIAESETDYIEIAVKLGLDPAWRRHIAERMNESHDRLFDDQACVVGLEWFYRQIVHDKLNEQIFFQQD